MTDSIQFKQDWSEFLTTFGEYMKWTSRDLATAVNTKLFHIWCRAVANTPKANKLAIGKALSRAIYQFGDKGQRRLVKVTRFSRFGLAKQVPVAALLINADRARKGKKGLYGAKMKRAANRLIANRQSSVSFLKAGFVPGIRSLSLLADRGGAPPFDMPRAKGQPKGYAFPAMPGMTPTATVSNTVGSAGPLQGKRQAALRKYGEPAVQKAVNDERGSMMTYMEQKARNAAQRVGIKVRG